jgi:hypothetical protein
VLLKLFARALGLERVANVRERQLDTGVGEHAREHQRVVIVGRVVVGDDSCWGHGASIPTRPYQFQ